MVVIRSLATYLLNTLLYSVNVIISQEVLTFWLLGWGEYYKWNELFIPKSQFECFCFIPFSLGDQLRIELTWNWPIWMIRVWSDTSLSCPCMMNSLFGLFIVPWELSIILIFSFLNLKSWKKWRKQKAFKLPWFSTSPCGKEQIVK